MSNRELYAINPTISAIILNVNELTDPDTTLRQSVWIFFNSKAIPICCLQDNNLKNNTESLKEKRNTMLH